MHAWHAWTIRPCTRNKFTWSAAKNMIQKVKCIPRSGRKFLVKHQLPPTFKLKKALRSQAETTNAISLSCILLIFNAMKLIFIL